MKGNLFENKVVIEDTGAQELYQKGGYGDFENNKLELALIEALYLLEGGKIDVYSNERKLSFNMLTTMAKKKDRRFVTRYTVYKDIRTRGYVTKTALKYGADFLVYPRGKKPWEEHSKWALFCVHESEAFDWRKFVALNRVAHSVRKDLLMGIVDDLGDVTYYESSWVRP